MDVSHKELINNYLQKLKDYYDRIHNSSNLFDLLHDSIISNWDTVNVHYIKFLEERDTKKVSDLIAGRNISIKYKFLKDKYSDLYQRTLYDLQESEFDYHENSPFYVLQCEHQEFIKRYKTQLESNHVITDDDFCELDVYCPDYDTYTQTDYSFTMYGLYSKSISSKYHSSKKELYEVFVKYNNILNALWDYKESILGNHGINQEQLINSLEDGLRLYSKELGKDVEKDLIKGVKKLKEHRSAPITEHTWGDLLCVEDEVYEEAIKGTLKQSKDDRFCYFDTQDREMMEDNTDLLLKIKSTAVDEELFDIKSAVENYKLLEALREENLDLFYELVLRRNLINTHIFPDFKTHYEAWLNSNNEDCMPSREPVVLFTDKAMRMWNKLQVAGYIDNNYKPIKTRKNSANKFAIIASVMADQLELSPRWKPFEDLWGIKNMTNKYSQALNNKYFSEFQNDIKMLIEE